MILCRLTLQEMIPCIGKVKIYSCPASKIRLISHHTSYRIMFLAVTKEEKQEFTQSNNYCMAESLDSEGLNLGYLNIYNRKFKECNRKCRKLAIQNFV